MGAANWMAEVCWFAWPDLVCKEEATYVGVQLVWGHTGMKRGWDAGVAEGLEHVMSMSGRPQANGY